ncbi:MAG TPA: cobalamin-independent methionine synthase II family protein [Gaiellaceae bacterium]|jgi:5-methyltetrahydropteroyltriglutamate--homocysteine methyltransferase|nr:cobalamin-independent methionine synthase II family protein [Gaiellaceae bacterium]
MSRIRTTHTGSLPRPADLVEALVARQTGGGPSDDELHARVDEAVAEAVARQVQIGIDVVSDGEMGKPGFHSYVAERLTGFGGESPFPPMQDLEDFPEYAAELYQRRGARIHTPRCIGPVSPRDTGAVERDVDRLRAAARDAGAGDAFMPAASPGVIVQDFVNEHYETREEYLWDVAQAMQPEYRAIVEGGLLLQVDCPDLAMGRHVQYADAALEDFRAAIRQNVEALNAALEGLPRERVRLHVCWGNYPGPHHRDVPLRDIVDVVLGAHAGAISFEAANPRHGHEWRVFEELELPEGMTLVPGVIDTATTHVEHPELVAERLVRLAGLVGADRVMAGSDCGFGTFAGVSAVHPTLAWAKLEALAEGARLASAALG